MVFPDMLTNSRYITSVDAQGEPNLASTYFNIAALSSNSVSVSSGSTATIKYNLSNKVNDNINKNNLNFYLKLLDENQEEASSSKVTISQIKINNNAYSYVSGKGYGPISLAYDGITEDVKEIDITLSCNSSYKPSNTLNYKIEILAVDATDPYIYTTKTADLNINVTFVAEYTVSFNSNGGSDVTSQTVQEGSGITQPANPTKSGYTFSAWYKEDTLTNLWDFSNDTVSSNITLYAKWVTTNIFFQLPPDWNGNEVYAYIYNSGDASVKISSWPGEKMTLLDSSKNIYSYDLNGKNCSLCNCINFADASSSTRQSVDVSFSSDMIGKIFVPELYNSTTVKRVLFAGSTNWSPYLYYWKDKKNNGWPGVVMEKVCGGGYSKTIDSSTYNMMIFNKGSGGTVGIVQTANLSIPVYQDLTYDMTTTGNGYRRFYFGSWHSYESWPSSGYATWKSGDYVKFAAAQSALGY